MEIRKPLHKQRQQVHSVLETTKVPLMLHQLDLQGILMHFFEKLHVLMPHLQLELADVRLWRPPVPRFIQGAGIFLMLVAGTRFLHWRIQFLQELLEVRHPFVSCLLDDE